MIILRPYQNIGVGGIRACFKRFINYVLFVLPTGGGKTVVFTFIAQAMSLKRKRVIILVHRIELLRQTSAELEKFEVEHGMVNPQYTPNLNNFVQVASVQTLMNRLNYFAAANWIADAIIIDEAHHATAGSWRKIIDHFKELNPDLKVIGVTATPIRADGQGLGISHKGMFEELVLGPSIAELINEGYLVRPKVFSPPRQFDPSELKTYKGDYRSKDLESVVDKPKITGDAVEHYKQVCDGAPAIAYCVSVAHAEHVAAEFQAAGYRFYSIDGAMDNDTRNWLINGLKTGEVQGLTSCDLISEGTDIPRATAAIKLRPTKSKGLNMQQDGRVLRPVYAEGFDLSTREGRLAAIAASEKPFAIILDHVGNVGSWVNGEFVTNHGLPDEDHEWTLDGEVKRGRGKANSLPPVRIQVCMSCFATHEPMPVCPQCGHVYEIKDLTPKVVAGQLEQVTAEMIQKKNKRMEIGRAQTLEELLAIAEKNGYKPEWAYMRNRQKEKKLEAIAARQAAAEEARGAQTVVHFEANGFDEVMDF